ncbi:MAG: glycosyltransferase [Gammaproteobacteria bacterium]|nr:glycosyltransferase [Gammaproteobacteria bacterium]
MFIIDALGTGGAEKMVLSISDKLIELGHDVSVLIIRDDISFKVPKEINLHVLGYKKLLFLPQDLIYAFRLRKYVSNLESVDGKFDVITSNLNLSNRLTHIARMKNVYYCILESVSSSSLFRRKGLKRLVRWLRLKRILDKENIIAVSEGIKEDLLNVVKIKPRSIRTIYNGVNFERITSLAAQSDISDRGEYIVHVGRLNPVKRHDILLDAFKLSGLDCKLVLVGDGQERENIKKKIEQLGLGGQVEMTGNILNQYPVIKNAQLMVMSSDYEGLPTVLLESFALSTPVVSVDCLHGPREILGEQYQKYLARQGDTEDLAKKMKMAMDDIKQGKMAVRPEHVERFSIENVARQYVELGRS